MGHDSRRTLSSYILVLRQIYWEIPTLEAWLGQGMRYSDSSRQVFEMYLKATLFDALSDERLIFVSRRAMRNAEGSCSNEGAALVMPKKMSCKVKLETIIGRASNVRDHGCIRLMMLLVVPQSQMSRYSTQGLLLWNRMIIMPCTEGLSPIRCGRCLARYPVHSQAVDWLKSIEGH